MAVVLIGTLDTKGGELMFVRDRLAEAGLTTWVIDAGVQDAPGLAADTPNTDVFAAAGTSVAAVRAANDRGRAVTDAAAGVTKVVTRLHAEGKVDGVFGLGGSAGTAIGTAAMRALPYGVPKLMVSTMASGQVAHYVGVRDVCMVHSVTDLCGLNRFTRRILENAANAVAGMCSARPVAASGDDRPLITATMFGVTTPCVAAARTLVEAGGFEVLVFHATGTGGRTMEAMIDDGLIAGVLDVTTTELADELVGGVLTAGPDRLTAASLRGVPQVISLGALDMVNFGPPDTVPERFKGRRFYQHNPSVTLMRTTPEENDRLGKTIVEKACAARGPVALLVPLRGVSMIDKEGGPFWWPEADRALFQSIRDTVAPPVKLIELDLHINDPAFAKAAAETLLAMM
ncbi:MAG TPA: Tm-1-like ATP-binding domain-containing protein [Gemmataceae bacterium]|nr:Tm-1-like ATP-binding domain-containing protein [Gemmataceae bacterium]